LKKALILANGKPPSKSKINFLMKNGFSTLFCADGGVNSAYKMELTPDYIIGDLDSADSNVLNHFKSKSKIIKYKRQNDTDVEKCLKYAISKKFEHVILLGGTGDRLDHTFCNLGITLKFYDKIRIDILHEKSYLQILEKNNTIKTFPKEIISLYGFDNKTKVTSQGLKYPLKNQSIKFGEKESTSNVAIGDKATINIRNGKLFLIRDYKMLVKLGYFFSN